MQAQSVAKLSVLLLFVGCSGRLERSVGAESAGGGGGTAVPPPTASNDAAGGDSGHTGGTAADTGRGGRSGGTAEGGRTMPSAGATAIGGATSPSVNPALEEIVGMPNEYGVAWKSSFMLAPCYELDAPFCITVPNSSCASTGVDFLSTGRLTTEDFRLGGEVGKTYVVTIRVNGIVSAKYYSGGMRRRGTDHSNANDPAGSDAWHVGGTPKPTSYESYGVVVLAPDGMTELQRYYLNSFPEESGYESHQTFPIGYEASFEVPGGGVIRNELHDPNCRAIDNCGPGLHEADCPAPRHVPNEPELVLPETFQGTRLAELNPRTGGDQPFHSQLVHITVLDVALKD